MDRTDEDEGTHGLAAKMGCQPVMLPKSHRVAPWEYDQKRHRRRNEVECRFRRLQGFRRAFLCFDKLNVIFLGFADFALIIDALRNLNTP